MKPVLGPEWFYAGMVNIAFMQIVDLLRRPPDAGRDQFGGGGIVSGILFEASCAASEVLDAIAGALGEVASLTAPAREGIGRHLKV